MKPIMLMVGDSPTVPTGFGIVNANLAKRWLPNCERIDFWGVNYHGWPHDLPYKIFPAGYGHWNSPEKLGSLLELVMLGDYTHIWISCDTHNLCDVEVPIIEGGVEKSYPFYHLLRRCCDQKKIKITFYYPVDSPLSKDEMGMVTHAHVAATITEYGAVQTFRACGRSPLVIPHGVDTGVFYPREDRDSLRQTLFNGWLKEDDFFMVNVNRNEQRKAPHHSLEILKLMLDAGVKAKLLMHMPRTALREGIDLEEVGARLGLPCGENWSHNDSQFINRKAKVTSDGLNQLYNAADVVLSTTLGEGWGLSQTEGAAAGCRIASPYHTACAEIADKFTELEQRGQFTSLPLSHQCVLNQHDLSRIRYPVDVPSAAGCLIAMSKGDRRRFPLNDAVKNWLDWDLIAAWFLENIL